MAEDEYEKLLERAFAESPSQEVVKQDFEIPKVDSMIQGSKTIIRNVNAIADRARSSSFSYSSSAISKSHLEFILE